MKQITRSKSLTEVAADELRAAIVNGSLSLGQLLSENTLAETLGISRTPVREALSQLRLEGLVKATPKGSCVFTLSAKEVRELCAFRFGLESLGLKSALAHNAQAYSEALSDVVQQMEDVQGMENVREYLKLDTRFHQLAFIYSGNRYLEEACRMVEGKISALRTHLGVLHDLTDKTMNDHRRIADAVKIADQDAALKILDRHINSVSDYYEEHISDIAASDAQKRG